MNQYNIDYAAVCHTGKIRDKNQDNFWCDSVHLDSENDGFPGCLSGTLDIALNSALCVFDGMGGEQQGEMAAYIAAKEFDAIYKTKDKSDTKTFLVDACIEMNDEICKYQKENHIRQMGATAAILMCGSDGVYACNLGDSRIYHYHKNKLTQLSHDHVHVRVGDRKAPLTQSLGIPETEFTIEPYISKGLYRSKDRYLICSDGLTDMANDDDIADVLRQNLSLQETAEMLLNMSLDRGGVDNITIILCEVQTKKKTIFKQKQVFTRVN